MASALKQETQKIDIVGTIELREGTEIDMSLRAENWIISVWSRLKVNRVAIYSLYYVLAMILIGFIYPILVPASPTSTEALFAKFEGGGARTYPNLRHPFGTDFVGRDVVAMILAGTRTSMLVGVGSTIIFLSIGMPLGLIASYYGGRTEELIMRFTDLILALPFLVIAILAISWLKKTEISFFSNMTTPVIILITLGFFGWAGTTRLVNATTKQILNLEYVAAARTLGASDRRIITNHLLPNIIAPVIVIGTLGVAGGILSEAGLMFLGFGEIAKDVSWGTIIALGQDFVSLHPQLSLTPGFMVFFVVLAINLLGDAVRDALDPRLKR